MHPGLCASVKLNGIAKAGMHAYIHAMQYDELYKLGKLNGLRLNTPAKSESLTQTLRFVRIRLLKTT